MPCSRALSQLQQLEAKANQYRRSDQVQKLLDCQFLIGKLDEEFKKKPELALNLIDRSLRKGHKPGIVINDSGSTPLF